MKSEDKIKNEMLKIERTLWTKNENTWCPGCPDYYILISARKAIAKLIDEGYKKENFVMAAGIGCHGKIFDYLDINGIYGLHGRVLPLLLGMKSGNPKLTVLGFAGDGDTYSEGMSHFIHAGRYNADTTLIVHDNQSFSLTTGQATATTQKGYKSKAEPLGNFNEPLDPIKLALASGVSFIARCNARDVEHTAEIIEKAIRHKGFSFVEVIQDCIIFNLEVNNKDKLMYKIPDNADRKKAMEIAEEWDYSKKEGRIPLGVIFKEERKTLTENYQQLNKK